MTSETDATSTTAIVSDSGPGKLKVQVAVGGQSFIGDEPVAVGGTGLGPAPHDLLSAALAECTVLTLRLYADRKSWPLEAIEVAVTHEVQANLTPKDLFHRVVWLSGPLDEAQRARLLEIAERCPVHRTLDPPDQGLKRRRLADSVGRASVWPWPLGQVEPIARRRRSRLPRRGDLGLRSRTLQPQ